MWILGLKGLINEYRSNSTGLWYAGEPFIKCSKRLQKKTKQNKSKKDYRQLVGTLFRK